MEMSAKLLSDRVIEPSNDVIEKILDTDFVQKLLMTGELNDRNRVLAQRMYKNLHDMIPFSKKVFKDVLKIPGLSNEEMGFYLQMDEEYCKTYRKYLEDLKQIIGTIPPEVMSAPVRKPVEEYQKIYADVSAKNSFVHILSTGLAAYTVPCSIYNYLVSQPNYKENELANLLTYRTLSADMALMALKSFADNRAKEVTPEIEPELKDCYRKAAEIQFNMLSNLASNK